MLYYEISVFCYELSMQCYAMVYVVKDKHSATVRDKRRFARVFRLKYMCRFPCFLNSFEI